MSAALVAGAATLLLLTAAPALAQDFDSGADAATTLETVGAPAAPVADDINDLGVGITPEVSGVPETGTEVLPAQEELLPASEPTLARQMIAPLSVSDLTGTVGNPAMPERCGVNAAVVVDLSNSIGDVGLRQSKVAAKVVADAVAASGGYLGLYDFATYAPASRDLQADWLPLFNSQDMSAARHKIDDLRRPDSNRGGTNWEGGLSQVLNSGRAYDFVYFITDGVPTANNDYNGGWKVPAGTRTDGGSIPHFADLDNAIKISNQLKSTGSHVIPVAVGMNDGNVPVMKNSAIYSGEVWGGWWWNNVRTWNGASYNLGQVDHYQTSEQMLADIDPEFVTARDYEQLVATMNSVLHPCQATVVVEKQVVDARGNAVPNQSPTFPSRGWTFTTAGVTAGLQILNPDDKKATPNRVETTQQNGLTREIILKSTTPATQGTVEIRETAREGYRLRPQSGANAVCHIGEGITFENTSNFTPVPVADIGAEGVKVPVQAGRTTHCIVQNQENNGSAAILKGPRPGNTVEVDPDGRAELVYTVEVSSQTDGTGAPRDTHTGEIREAVMLPEGVVADGEVTVAFSPETGVQPTGVATTLSGADFTAGRELRLADDLLLPAGKKATFTITVPVKVGVITGEEWDRLDHCEFDAKGGYVSGGVPNAVVMDNDVDGTVNNTACIPLIRVAPAAVTVVKTDAAANELAGAKFALYAAAWDAENNPIGPAGAPLFSDLPVVDGSDSRFVAHSLREGHYYLVEVQAPNDYSLLASPVGFRLERDSAAASGYRLSLLDPASHGHVVQIVDDLVIQVADTTTGQLPASGGGGVAPYILTAIAIITAGISMARRIGTN